MTNANQTHEKTGLFIGQQFDHPKFGWGTIIDFPNFGYHATVKFKDSMMLFNPTNLKLIIARNTYIHLVNDKHVDPKFCFLKRYLINGSSDQFVSMDDMKNELGEVEFRKFAATFVSHLVRVKNTKPWQNY